MAIPSFQLGQNEEVSKRLSAVPGDSGKVNDVFVLGNVTGCQQHIIYFGGDVQDYSENMSRHRDNKRYTEWSTENTVSKIHRKFPRSLVIAIKPTSMHLMTFSVYSTFVEANDFGSCPTHSSDYGAVKHLAALYTSLLKDLHGIENLVNSPIPVKIIGFSKGCVVLNQMVFELSTIQEDTLCHSFLSKVDSFYWLDGGHSGGTENTWVNDVVALQHLTNLHCDIHIHVTPYQVKCPLRPWVGKQQSEFYKKLKELGAKVRCIAHFDEEPPSIENHFRVLEEFV